MRSFLDDLKKPIILFGVLIVFMAVLICLTVSGKKEEKKQEEIAHKSDTDKLEVVDLSQSPQQAETEDVPTAGHVDDDGVTLLYDSRLGKEYLQNCIFLGDSRIVGMALYGFIDTNTALAQIGLTHNNAMNVTYETSTGKKYTFDSYLTTHPAKVIYICYGVNGLTQSEERYKAEYQKLVEHVKMMAPGSMIVIQSIWPARDGGPYESTVSNAKIDYYNEFLYDLAAEEGFYYLDVQGILKDETGNMMSSYDSGDGLHYNRYGYAEIMDYIISHPVPGIVPTPNGYEKEVFVWENPTGNGAPDSKTIKNVSDNQSWGSVSGNGMDGSVSGNQPWDEPGEGGQPFEAKQPGEGEVPIGPSWDPANREEDAGDGFSEAADGGQTGGGDDRTGNTEESGSQAGQTGNAVESGSQEGRTGTAVESGSQAGQTGNAAESGSQAGQTGNAVESGSQEGRTGNTEESGSQDGRTGNTGVSGSASGENGISGKGLEAPVEVTEE